MRVFVDFPHTISQNPILTHQILFLSYHLLNASATCPRSPRERPITAGDNEASLGRVWDHKKLLERVFLLCTASIYHYDNILPDAGMYCACIPHVRALLCTLLAMPGMSRGYSWYVVTTRRLRDAFGTTKSFWSAVFCSAQLAYIITTTYKSMRTCAARVYPASGPFWARDGRYSISSAVTAGDDEASPGRV